MLAVTYAAKLSISSVAVETQYPWGSWESTTPPNTPRTREIAHYSTDGQKEKHPFQEAQAAMARLKKETEQAFTHFLFLHFRATNAEPYPFEWVDHAGTVADYGAMLVRISREYDRRF